MPAAFISIARGQLWVVPSRLRTWEEFERHHAARRLQKFREHTQSLTDTTTCMGRVVGASENDNRINSEELKTESSAATVQLHPAVPRLPQTDKGLND